MKYSFSVRTWIVAALAAVCLMPLRAQLSGGSNDVTGQFNDVESGYNPVTTAVPFLQLSPDARSSALGDQGVATSGDIYSQHYNAAKYPFAEGDWGLSLSYSPWLFGLATGMNLATLTGMYKVTDRDVLSASFTYFSMGRINIVDREGRKQGSFRPNEFCFDVAYSRKLIDVLALSVTGRFIYSDLTLKHQVGNRDTKAGMAGAVDIGLYYNQGFDFGNFQKGIVSVGFSLTNIGNKINYISDYDLADKNFLPAALRLGVGFNYVIDNYNSLAVYAESCKYLVPTSPKYEGDSIIAGKDNNVNVFQGLIQSFYDAPGGTIEEFREVMWSVGLEYNWNKLLAVRAGYFHENKYKGNRQYVSLGVGVQYKMVGLDFSYVVPTSGSFSANPMKNTLRVGIRVKFDVPGRQRSVDEDADFGEF